MENYLAVEHADIDERILAGRDMEKTVATLTPIGAAIELGKIAERIRCVKIIVYGEKNDCVAEAIHLAIRTNMTALDAIGMMQRAKLPNGDTASSATA